MKAHTKANGPAIGPLGGWRSSLTSFLNALLETQIVPAFCALASIVLIVVAEGDGSAFGASMAVLVGVGDLVAFWAARWYWPPWPGRDRTPRQLLFTRTWLVLAYVVFAVAAALAGVLVVAAT